MNCNVTPLRKYAEISYRVKCVSVENERVFGDVYVTQQTRNLLYCADGYQFPTLYGKRKSNLIHKNWKGPDFMEINKKKPIRRASYAEALDRVKRRNGLKRSKSVNDTGKVIDSCRINDVEKDIDAWKPKIYPPPLPNPPQKKEEAVSSLVDQLLLDIYGLPDGERRRSESESTVSSLRVRPQHQHLQKARLLWKSKHELEILILNLRDHINHTGGILVRQLRRKDYLTTKRDKLCAIITAHLQAASQKRVEDTKMRFSLTPQPGESGFIQWLDAMKMVARLPGGIPPEFRKKLWLTLAERHLDQRGVDWKQAEKICFNEWSNPDDEELGIQIVKDLHRTGCSLFCGAAGRDNQAVLRRVLLGFARWNKSVGYCQGLNVLAALVLQVMDRAESAAVKVMIYLIEGVLPEGYFADNLRGLSVDMAVFRDLLRARLPKLSKHLEALQNDAKDKATGSSYEPPLTNVFTMQWFLTLFCHCLPQEAVLRVWDLIFLEGDEILLRTALAIWEGLSDRIMTVTSADEFYSIMGVLTREMLEFTDTNNLIKNIVSMGPLHGVTGLREKHRYNITPWARKLSDDDDSDTEEDERLAVAAAMFSMAQRLKKDRLPQTLGALQAMAPGSDRERLALDISTLKQQYAKLRERQRQAHIILSAACARQTMVPPPASQAMNHLLVGKNALVSGKNRPLSLPSAPTTQAKSRPAALNQNRRDRQAVVTLHWKDTKKAKQKAITASGVAEATVAAIQPSEADLSPPKYSNGDSDSDSTSTELCDEPDRLSDVDSEDLTSASDSYVATRDEEKNLDVKKTEPAVVDAAGTDDMSIAKITDQIRRLSAEDDNNSMVPRKFTAKDSDDSPKQLENEKSIDFPIDYPEGATVKKSLALDEYDYLSYSSEKVLGSKDDEVLVHRYATEEIGNTLQDVTTNIKEESVIKEESPNVYSDFSIPFDKYDSKDTGKPLYDLNIQTEDRFKSYDFSGRLSLDTKPYESSNLSSLTTSDAMNTDYVRTYPPISPVTVDKKLSVTPIIHGSTISDTLKPETILDKTYKPEILFETYKSEKPYTYPEKIQTKLFSDLKSPKTPESAKSFGSGETMGPDSKPSSLTVSPRTPVRSDSRDFSVDKSACSSISSDSKTLVRSTESKDSAKRVYEMSDSATPVSVDSLKNKSDVSPKLVVSSSSDSCSPGKLKSSERSFSSDLQSPISANSIKYTSNLNRRGQDDVSGSSIDLSSATSPFYPIANPNQKTPTSPHGISRRKSSLDSAETSPEQRSSSSNRYLNYQKFDSPLKTSDLKEIDRRKDDIIKPEFRREDSVNLRNGVGFYQTSNEYAFDDGGDDPLSEKDVVPSLPQEKLDKHYLNYRYRDRSKLLERSSSSLDSRRYADLKSSSSADEFSTSIVKKRSSDILEDIKHLEAKANDGSSDSGMLTKKSSYIWEDMKSLEARRQDTFSNSASTFSKRRLEIPNISVTGENRSYVVHPKINIDENSDSILKTVACSKSDDDDDGGESKLGVWTKVKPRKKSDNGRRNSDRALKIIQENSAILQKILACQAKKRLPDLEEISKEITISPINEEISKIFSPILEKMGLNEHEINEELARINFKDFDSMTATSVSEFDAKINEELSKLSLIDETEQMDQLDVEDVISHEYLDTREALIDRKINEELSKLLANYEDSPSLDKRPTSQNVSEIDGLDVSSISTNVFSYKSSNDSIDTRSDSTQEPIPKYTETLPYVRKYVDDSSPKSDIDIYRELDKLDKISSAQILPEDPVLELPQKEIPSIPYVPVTSPFKDVPPLRYASKPIQYDASPLKASYKSFDFKPKPSPSQASNPFATYEKPDAYVNHKSEMYDLHLKSPMLAKESLEFRVRYDEDTDYMSLPPERSSKSPYYSNGNSEHPLTPTKYPKEDRCGSFLESSDLLHRKYEALSPKEYGKEYERRLGTISDAGSYLPRQYPLSPSRQFPEQPSIINHYATKLSPGVSDDSKRPVSHPEFPGKMTIGKYTELPERGSSSYKKSSLSLGNIGKGESNYNTVASPKTQFSPFPVRNAPRKPKELTLKLGLYSPNSPDVGQLKRS